MVTRIIKKGSARAMLVRPFTFDDNVEISLPSTESAEWGDPIPIPCDNPVVPSGDNGDSLQDAAALEKAAYERGLAEGEKRAMEMAERRFEGPLKRYADSIAELQKLRTSLCRQTERDIVKLAIAIARKIVQREIRVDREIIQSLVHVALSRVTEKSAVTIRLNPEDYSYLLERHSELSQAEGREISLAADQSIERGGCLIQTNCGDIDARIEEQFREVENAFFEGMN